MRRPVAWWRVCSWRLSASLGSFSNASAALLVFLALFAGVNGTTLGYFRAEQARQAEEQQRHAAEAAETKEKEQRKVAQQEAELANAVKSFLQFDVLQLADPATQQRQGKALKYDADLRPFGICSTNAASSPPTSSTIG
jgi:hypothetical protein